LLKVALAQEKSKPVVIDPKGRAETQLALDDADRLVIAL